MNEYRRTDDGVETPERERRAVTGLELRTNEDGQPILEGYATVYEYPYDVAGGPERGGFTEVITRGAGAKTANDGDIRLLINHDGVPLARSKGGKGTMRVISDDIGMRIEAPLDTTNPRAVELISAMQRGDIDQMSFAFSVVDNRQSWSDGYDTRRIDEFRAVDVSAVTYPANPATVMKLRAEEPQAEQASTAAGRSLALAKRQAEADKSRRR